MLKDARYRTNRNPFKRLGHNVADGSHPTFDSIHSCLYFFVYEYHRNYISSHGRISVGDGVSPTRWKR